MAVAMTGGEAEGAEGSGEGLDEEGAEQPGPGPVDGGEEAAAAEDAADAAPTTAYELAPTATVAPWIAEVLVKLCFIPDFTVTQVQWAVYSEVQKDNTKVGGDEDEGEGAKEEEKAKEGGSVKKEEGQAAVQEGSEAGRPAPLALPSNGEGGAKTASSLVVHSSLLWFPGLWSDGNEKLTSTSAIDINRASVLECFIAVMATALFQPGAVTTDVSGCCRCRCCCSSRAGCPPPFYLPPLLCRSSPIPPLKPFATVPFTLLLPCLLASSMPSFPSTPCHGAFPTFTPLLRIPMHCCFNQQYRCGSLDSLRALLLFCSVRLMFGTFPCHAAGAGYVARLRAAEALPSH